MEYWDHNTQSINLDGEWEFYWNQLLTYRDFQQNHLRPDIYATVPSTWNTYKINHTTLPRQGYGTYRLKVTTYLPAGTLVSLRLPSFSCAYMFSVNDQQIAANGVVATSSEQEIPEFKTMVAVFPVPAPTFDLIIQVSNHHYARGGLWETIRMGSVENINNYQDMLNAKEFFMIGALAILFTYYLSNYLLRRQRKENLYFALICILSVGMVDYSQQIYITKILPDLGFAVFVKNWYVSSCWITFFLVLFVNEIFPVGFPKIIIKSFFIVTFGFSLLFLLAPTDFSTRFVLISQIFTVTEMLCTVIISLSALIKGMPGALLHLVGLMILVLTYMHDDLFYNYNLLNNLGQILFVGVFAILFIQSLIQSQRLNALVDEKEQAVQRLTSLDKLKDEFLANTSHELRTPLNAIINVAEGIAQGACGTVNEEQAYNLSLITASGKRLTNLINDILDYSILKNAALHMNLEPVNLKPLVENVLFIMRRLDKSANVELYTSIPADLPYLNADQNRILQILYNLVGNALKFTDAGYVKISARQVGNNVECCVEDTGMGIPQDKLDRIFISFEQLEDSLTRKHGGAGLGLPISKQLVEAQGGSLWVESQWGRGSKFFFTIPVYIGPVEAKAASLSRSGLYPGGLDIPMQFPLRHKAEGPHIMLVDDSQSNLIALLNILKMDNYSVTALNTSEQFFAEFSRENDVALVVLDVMMPGLSGYEICGEIRKRYSVFELPVLMLTARTSLNDMLMGMEYGANDYLTKPFDTQELMARVKTLINLKESAEKARTAEMAFLHAQIKPHFLYNALNTFVSISRYDMDQARELIIEFGNYLRRSFDFRELSQLVPIKNELELVRAYTAIEKARFEERLEVNFDLTDELEDMIPMLIIQPLVENAVIHGILPRREGGRVDIVVGRDEEMLHIMVKDNGVGIDEETIRELLAKDRPDGVGLYNIDKRLQQLYGRGLDIVSQPGQGTAVNIFIPIRKGSR